MHAARRVWLHATGLVWLWALANPATALAAPPEEPDAPDAGDATVAASSSASEAPDWKLRTNASCPSAPEFRRRLSEAQVDPALAIDARIETLPQAHDAQGVPLPARHRLEVRTRWKELRSAWSLEDASCDALIDATVVTLAGKPESFPVDPYPRESPDDGAREPSESGDCEDCTVPVPSDDAKASLARDEAVAASNVSADSEDPTAPTVDEVDTPPPNEGGDTRGKLIRPAPGPEFAIATGLSGMEFPRVSALLMGEIGWVFGFVSLSAEARYAFGSEVRATIQEPDGSFRGGKFGDVTKTSGALRTCGHVAPVRWLAADTCVHLRFGAIFFAPAVPDLQDDSGAWIDTGVALGATFWPRPQFGLMLRGEASFPLVATGFRLGDSTLFQPNVAQFSLLGGIRVRIPRKTAAR